MDQWLHILTADKMSGIKALHLYHILEFKLVFHTRFSRNFIFAKRL